jgi:hypothetical protein
MADPLPSLDLRLTPDWVKESESPNRYADYTDRDSDGRGNRGNRERRDDRPRRPTQNRQRRDAGPPRRDSGGPPRRDSGGSNRPSPQPRPARPHSQPGREGSAGQFSERAGEGLRHSREETVLDQVEPAAVQVDFLPEERAFSKVIQQIKQGHAAYPLFGLARMFLERPERHRVRIRSLNDAVMIYQLADDGPVAMEMSALERIAFSEKKDDFYTSEIVEKEPIKGNFTSVARCGLSGRLLGPTNYHTFQKVIHALYEQRFSRRMGFEEYRRSIEITSDPALVNQWKEEARRVVTYTTKDQEEPAAFENAAAMEQHFRTNYLEKLIKPCLAAEVSGDVARHLPDRSIIAAIRRARERENRFPAQMAGALRHGLNQAGLHVFKHKKRILYISTIRPQLFDSNQAQVSSGLDAILATLRSYPRITRKQLAEKVLKRLLGEKSTEENSPEYQQAKNSLPTDLLWLAKAGHVIEFADGTLDLPLPPKAVERPGASHEAGAKDVGDQEDRAESEIASDLQIPEEGEGIEDAPIEEPTSREREPEPHEDSGHLHPAAEEHEAPVAESVSPTEIVEHTETIHHHSEHFPTVENVPGTETSHHAEDVHHRENLPDSENPPSDSIPSAEGENPSLQVPQTEEHPAEVNHPHAPAAEETQVAEPARHTAIPDHHDRPAEQEWAAAGS